MISLNGWNNLQAIIFKCNPEFEETTQNRVTDTLMKESVLAVFSFVEWYHWETYPFLFQFYLCNMASMVYNSWTKIGMPELIAVINLQAALCLLFYVFLCIKWWLYACLDMSALTTIVSIGITWWGHHEDIMSNCIIRFCLYIRWSEILTQNRFFNRVSPKLIDWSPDKKWF